LLKNSESQTPYLLEQFSKADPSPAQSRIRDDKNEAVYTA
jgi:hypothetical protein